jgi:ferrochelatase
MNASPRQGLLLVNLGTPDAPEPGAVGRYLREFLSDPLVLGMPAPVRWALVSLLIVPLRRRRSAALYRSIWLEEGSPLLVHTQDLARRVQVHLGPDLPVAVGMRYGRPSLGAALQELRDRGVEALTVLPLFPQFAVATWQSAVERTLGEVARAHPDLPVSVVPPYFEHPAFLAAHAELARPVLEEVRPDRVLLSFHGLPERQVRRADPTGRHCLRSPGCCETAAAPRSHCYRAQCLGTARGLARELELPPDVWEVAFQSRMGPVRWLGPPTARRLTELPAEGVQRLVVLCPSFVCDCLETLEEIGERGRAAFRAAGGERLALVPGLNAEPAWVEAVARLATEPSQEHCS